MYRIFDGISSALLILCWLGDALQKRRVIQVREEVGRLDYRHLPWFRYC